MEMYTSLGVEVAVTELDIRMELPPTPEKLTQQSSDFASVVAACHRVEGCVGVTVWDFADKYRCVAILITDSVAGFQVRFQGTALHCRTTTN
jgi:endo-1,4-beta-xylanase